MDPNILDIMIRTRAEVLYQGKGKTLSSYNEVGRFDVLPMHANFVSLISKSIDIYQSDGILKQIPIDEGIMRVKQNKIEIYLGIRSRKGEQGKAFETGEKIKEALKEQGVKHNL